MLQQQSDRNNPHYPRRRNARSKGLAYMDDDDDIGTTTVPTTVTKLSPQPKPDLTTTSSGQKADAVVELPTRSIRWEYVIPIVFTPAAHICVSLIRKYPQYKKPLFHGVIITTFLTINARMILMYDAGYPGGSYDVPLKREELPWYLKMFLF